MQQRTRYRRFTMGLLSIGLLVGAALMAGPAQAQTTSVGPYYATPSWDQTLPTATRFIVLSNFASAAVLDGETGLVWEKSPQTAAATWSSARLACTSKTTGGRKGWRLPSVHELASLIEPSVPFPGPTLPVGHPFTNVQSNSYWSATTEAVNPSGAWLVHFSNGPVSPASKTGSFRVWCVRGGMNAEVY